MSPTISTLAPGQRFGPYLVEGTAGRGGMGVVYRARDTNLGRLVALKVLAQDLVAPDDALRFLREARVAASLSHPGIVVVHDAGSFGGMPYVVMEWIDGVRLDAIVDDPSLDDARRVEIALTIAEVLAFAHGKGVIHRDVKPSNVMLDQNGRVKLLDFGLAKRAHPGLEAGVHAGTRPFETRAGSVLGTPAYMAPEQRVGVPLDARVDQFAWGVLAYELLARAHPSETVPIGAGAFPAARPQPISWLRPHVGETVAAVVHRAMSFAPEARFASMDEVVAILHGSLGRSPQSALPSSLRGVAIETAPTTAAPVFATLTPRAPPSKAHRWKLALAAAGVLLVLAAAAVTLRFSGATTALGLTSAHIESGLEDVAFAVPPADVAKTVTDLEGRLTSCFDARTPRDHLFKIELTIEPDGRVTKVTEQDVCKEVHANFYLCTERGKTPKPKYPEAPERVFACIEHTFVSTRFPPLATPRNEAPSPVEATIYVELR